MVERTTCVVKPTKVTNIVVCVSSRVRSVKVQTIEGACNKAKLVHSHQSHPRQNIKRPITEVSLQAINTCCARTVQRVGFSDGLQPAIMRSDLPVWTTALRIGRKHRRQVGELLLEQARMMHVRTDAGVSPKHSSRRQNVRFHRPCWEVTMGRHDKD
ncbi:hypothetical protein CN136_30045 [Sinorhizobium meliloti]|nr:hypothetical protein CN136_30045 [Sinorhizobium meliloti]